MLKFDSYTVKHGLLFLTNRYAKGYFPEHEFIISQNPYTKDWDLNEYLFGVLESEKTFRKLADAKEWANRQNAYLEGI